MAKKHKKVQGGEIVKEAIYTAPEPRDTHQARAAKSRMTRAAQKAMNDKTARGRLEMIMAENFTRSDLFVTLTYRDEDLPDRRKDAVQNVRKFLRKFREWRKTHGQTLKYIYTTESKHEAGRYHHHLVINAAGGDLELIRALWPHGDMVSMEYIGNRDYGQLAAYITKEGVEGRPVGAQMWTASRNLSKPHKETRYVPNCTELEIPVGVIIMEREEKMTEFGSYSYVKYRIPPNYWGAEDKQESVKRPGASGSEALISCS